MTLLSNGLSRPLPPRGIPGGKVSIAMPLWLDRLLNPLPHLQQAMRKRRFKRQMRDYEKYKKYCAVNTALWKEAGERAQEKRRAEQEEHRLELSAWRHRKELLDDASPPVNDMMLRAYQLEYVQPSPGDIERSESKEQRTFDQIQSRFVQLPAEIRLQIYEAAFGDRTVHLFYGFWPGNWRGGQTWRIGKSDGFYFSESASVSNMRANPQTLPNQWHFFHSICPQNERFAPAIGDYWLDDGAAHQHCIYKARSNEGFVSQEPYGMETLGVMGALRSCRLM
jgi:hypothetical protein